MFSYYGDNSFYTRMPFRFSCAGRDNYGYCNTASITSDQANDPLNLFPNITTNLPSTYTCDPYPYQPISCDYPPGNPASSITDIVGAIRHFVFNGITEDFIEGSNQNPDIDCAKLYSLKEIHYPTGGSTLFEYELNYYLKTASSGEDPGEGLRYGGGLRLKRMTSLNQFSEPFIVEYDYDLSGVVTNQQKWNTPYLYLPGSTGPQTYGRCLNIVHHTAPVMNSNPVSYRRVYEKYPEGAIEYGYITAYNFPATYESWYLGYFPGCPPLTFEPMSWSCSIFPFTSGWQERPFYTSLLSYKATYNDRNIFDNHTIVELERYLYDYIDGGYIYGMEGHRWDETCNDNIRANIYRIPVGKSLKKEKILTNYYHRSPDIIDEVIDSTKYTYNIDFELVKKIERVQSDGKRLVTQYSYPFDIENPNLIFTKQEVLDSLISKNLFNLLLIEESFIDDEKISGTINVYDFMDDNYKDILCLRAKYRLVNNEYNKELNFDSHDIHGNLMQYNFQNDKKITFLWGYNFLFPVCKIENVEYTTVVNQLGCSYNELQTKSSQELTVIFNSLRENPAMQQSQIYSYTYLPLIGITSMTNPANITTYYQYDEFGRLIDVLDHEKYLTHHYEYNYQQCTLEVNPEDLFFDYSAGQQSVSINSNSFWNASESIDWIDIYPKNGHQNGSIQISCSENPSTEDRTAQIHVSCGEVIKAITLNQAAACYIEVDPDHVFFSQNASSELITVNYNTEWNVSVLSGDWISITNINDAGFTINCTENTGPYREGAVYISGTDCGNIIISIEQSGSY